VSAEDVRIEALDDTDALRHLTKTAAEHSLADSYVMTVTVGFMRGLEARLAEAERENEHFCTILERRVTPARLAELEAAEAALERMRQELLRKDAEAFAGRNSLADSEVRVVELEGALRQIRSIATHNAERHTGFVHIGRIAVLANPADPFSQIQPLKNRPDSKT